MLPLVPLVEAELRQHDRNIITISAKDIVHIVRLARGVSLSAYFLYFNAAGHFDSTQIQRQTHQKA